MNKTEPASFRRSRSYSLTADSCLEVLENDVIIRIQGAGLGKQRVRKRCVADGTRLSSTLHQFSNVVFACDDQS